MPAVAPENRIIQSDNELHIGLDVPRHTGKQIHQWALGQPWPEGTELEHPKDYHVTLLYTPQGHGEHKDAWWLDHMESAEAHISGVKAFGAQAKGYAYVLTLDAPEIKAKADELQATAERLGLEVTHFPGGYQPHVTVAYGPSSRLTGVIVPNFSFDVGPSSVTPPRPREAAWHEGTIASLRSVAVQMPWGQDWDAWQAQKPAYDASGHQLGYDPAQHAEGKGFLLNDGAVWTWPTQQMQPMHMAYHQKVQNNNQQVVPGSAFYIQEGAIGQTPGVGRSLSPEQQSQITQADPRLTFPQTPPPPSVPGFGHGRNVLDILDAHDRRSAGRWSHTMRTKGRSWPQTRQTPLGARVGVHAQAHATERYSLPSDWNASDRYGDTADLDKGRASVPRNTREHRTPPQPVRRAQDEQYPAYRAPFEGVQHRDPSHQYSRFERVPYDPSQVPGLGTSLSRIALYLHGAGDEREIVPYTAQLLRAHGYPDDEITLTAAIQTWYQLYPSDARENFVPRDRALSYSLSHKPTFKRVDEEEDGKSTLPSEVNDPEDHWPEFGQVPPDKKRDIQFSNDWTFKG